MFASKALQPLELQADSSLPDLPPCAPANVAAGPLSDSLDCPLRLVLGLGHQLVLPDDPQDALQAECAMDVHDMLQW